MLDVTYNTNRFGLKLLEVNGITLSGSIFPLVACLSPDENGGIFEWALGQWKIWITEYALSLDLNDDAFYPHVVITDFDAAERWGIDRVFPLVQKQLYTEAEFLVLWQALQNDFSTQPVFLSKQDRHEPHSHKHALEHPVRPKPNETPLLHAWLPLKLYKCSKQQPQHHRVSSRYLTTLRYSSQPNRYSRYVNLTAFDRTQHSHASRKRPYEQIIQF
ncbi:MULE transposase [Hirsutella rhossiliensis]